MHLDVFIYFLVYGFWCVSLGMVVKILVLYFSVFSIGPSPVTMYHVLIVAEPPYVLQNVPKFNFFFCNMCTFNFFY